MRIHSIVRILGLAAGIAIAAAPLAGQDSPRVELLQSHFLGATPPMREYLATHHEKANPPFRVFPLRKPNANKGKPHGGGGGTTWTDPMLQTAPLPDQAFLPTGIKIDGIDGSSNSPGVVPPDTNISVGLAGKSYPAQIVETVNVQYAIYDTSGNTVQAPAPIHTIFSAATVGNGTGSDMCASVDGGDPVVLYDKIDDKWIISQLAYNSGLNNNHFCLAISENGDATGSYYAYDFSFGSNFPDYPKLGIWADGSLDDKGAHAGVYFSANTFAHGNKFTGAKVCAFPLSDVSAPPSNGIAFSCMQNGPSVFSLLPADLEASPAAGTTLPAPSGTAEYFLQFSGGNILNLYQFTPNFGTTTGTMSGPFPIGVATFHEACGGGACVPQKDTSEQLDSLGDRLMYRLSYRNYGNNGSGPSGQSMVVTQSVQDSSSSNQTGIRWYQLTSPYLNASTSGWVLGQQGTFGPNDGAYRWMGSIAQDKDGDLGVGYSVSSSTMYPDIAFTGRTPSDGTIASTAGTIYELEPETALGIGLGPQTSINRWGDYSSMSVDPSNDCTFWYANEYLKSKGSYTNWGTYIVGFRFTGCR
jgi:hypothetical protein